MRRIFGIIFVLGLILTPISFKVRADNPDTTTGENSGALDAIPPTSVIEENVSQKDPEVKNPIIILRNKLLKKLEGRAVELHADKVIGTVSRFSMLQRKFEELLKKLNNTD